MDRLNWLSLWNLAYGLWKDKGALIVALGHKPNIARVRVDYTFSSVSGEGSNTQYLKRAQDDIESLKQLRDEMNAE